MNEFMLCNGAKGKMRIIPCACDLLPLGVYVKFIIINCEYAYIHIYLHTCIPTCIVQGYMYTYIHKYMHAYIHSYTNVVPTYI